MDWSKAKSILIAALLVTNLFIGSFILSSRMKETSLLESEASSTETYLASRGVSLNCDLPVKAVKLPVLQVTFEAEAQEHPAEYSGSDMALSIEGADPDTVSSVEQGKAKIKVISASQAVLKAMDSFEDVSSIEALSLIYMVDRSQYGDQAGEDTALPYWAITTDKGVYYCSAVN